jgi:hypothetical protein
MSRRLAPIAVTTLLVPVLMFCGGVLTPAAQAQQGAAAPARRTARDAAPIDLVGQWVAVVTEDWRWRMVTPPKGDTASVPLNAAGRRVAEAWDLDKDRAAGNLCKPFGPPGIIRQPGRLRISWENDDTLAVQFDAGNQTRRFHFDDAAGTGARTLQGTSRARWFKQPQSRGIARNNARPAGGSLDVTTTNLRAGYLRPNGVPYSESATVREFFDTFSLGEDGTWLIVTTVVNDPTYLTQEFVISSQFRKEEDASRWSPRPCDIPPPGR